MSSINFKSEFETQLAPILGAAYGMARNLTRSADDAEDLVQDAAIKAFHAFAGFEKGSNFKAWFLRIVVNTFLNDARRQKARPQTVSAEEESSKLIYERAPSRDGNPPTALLQTLKAEEIRAAFARLPADFRVVALLYFYEERSYESIAQILDCPIGTVRSRLHRARKMLQNALRGSDALP